jgi:hypothetical protein
MIGEHIERKFRQIGARASVRVNSSDTVGVRLDVARDRRGEFFVIDLRPGTPLEVLDVDEPRKQLLLLAKMAEGKARFLCGHDERHWFVAALPEDRPAKSVTDAFEALKPDDVRSAERLLRSREKKQRRNAARLRQGEWFFVPAPEFQPKDSAILYHEPMGRMRNGRWLGKPHYAGELVRTGGEQVWIPTPSWNQVRNFPGGQRALESAIGTGLTDKEHAQFVAEHPDARSWSWTPYRRNPEVYVRGTVRHPDHKTLTLRTWHKVVQNTEPRARAMANVAFID